jgi:hypothetical protein
MPMSLQPGDDQDDQDDTQREADKQANGMKDQLRKEVAQWNATRDDTSGRQAADFSVPVAPPAAPRPAKRASRAKPAVVADAPTRADGPRKPFSMSFDGVTDAEHISYMIARGAR